ncbi:cell volume regulation protein A [Nitrospina gracilis]|nr:cell volume regulation protein A [Nitrospina sp. Nb-3]
MSVLVFVSILLEPVAVRTRAPLLLLFLILGALLGEDGPGGIQFNDFQIAYHLGTVTLAMILFAGGLETPIDDVKKAVWPASILATMGVVLTAAIVGTAASFLFDVPLIHGLLLGAVVGSTDAAATFLLLGHNNIRLRGRIRETILVESGVNDPMAVFLTLTLVTIVDTGTSINLSTLPELAAQFGLQLGLGAVIGLAGGQLLARMVNRVPLQSGLYPPLCLAGAFVIFDGTRLLGGSGFLAIYLTGLMLAWRLKGTRKRVVHFHEGLAWLSQIVMFIMLGLLITPSALGATLLPALAVAMVLMFVARPLAVAICLVPFRFPWRDHFYIGWVGLRGAVPIFLAIIPVISPGPVTVTFFNVVVIIVIASLVLQGWTIPWVAHLLKVEDKQNTHTAPAS